MLKKINKNIYANRNEFDEIHDDDEDFDLLECEERDIFTVMADTFMHVLKNHACINIQSKTQLEHRKNEGSMGILCCEDGKPWPYIRIAVLVRDWNPSVNRPSRFGVEKYSFKFTPFTCTMKNDIELGIDFSEANKELTRKWREIMREVYPEVWNKKFKEYLEGIKANKINENSSEKEKQDAEKEFQDELASMGLA